MRNNNYENRTSYDALKFDNDFKLEPKRFKMRRRNQRNHFKIIGSAQCVLNIYGCPKILDK